MRLGMGTVEPVRGNDTKAFIRGAIKKYTIVSDDILEDLVNYLYNLVKNEEKTFSDNREDASDSLIEKAKESGVIQKVGKNWKIVAIKKRKLWTPDYKTREDAEKALAAYHANKH